MAEEEKIPPTPETSTTVQDSQQIQAILRETIKENKSLQSKNAKLESKYVELFKQNKSLKQDRTILVSFAMTLFTTPEGKLLLQQPALGQCSIEELATLKQQKENAYKNTIKELEHKVADLQEESKNQIEREVKTALTKLNLEWQTRIKSSKDSQNKQFNSFQREIQSLKKTVDLRTNEIVQLKTLLETRTHQLSKISKEKLKMEHHLNNIRKKQISEELSPPKQPDQSKMLIDKNEYLALRQQVQTLMAKRDELKKELKKKQDQYSEERQMSDKLQLQLEKMTKIQRDCDEKYELVRECSLEDLETMIVNYNAPALNTGEKNEKMEGEESEENHVKDEEIQRQYLKNMVSRYIKAVIGGRNQQALTLLELIARLVKLDTDANQTLNQYISKQKQWWFIKY